MKHLLFIFILLLGSYSFAGNEGSGGGDSYTLDFVKVASQEIYPWLNDHGQQLSPAIDANVFLRAIEPERIVSVERVFESCDGTTTGREVEACFNAKTQMIYISRTRYPLMTQNSPAKRALIAHEIFRKMKVEGDGYEITRQIPILTAPGSKPDSAACGSVQESMAQILNSYVDALKVCYKLETQKKTDSSDYLQELLIAKNIEGFYPELVLQCNEFCANGFSCAAVLPSGACTKR